MVVSGRGESGGARTMVAFKTDSHMFFLFGFLKSEMENVGKKEVKAFKTYPNALFQLRDEQIELLVKNGDLSEVK
ncbi:type II toxin-antitoxin system RelE/ParE family toxin [bacterium]|nr:type II toxin-antitoxin system RelE/ParE family toxin [bacterium]